MPSGFDETIGCNTSKKTKVMKQGTMNILFFVLKTKLLKNGEMFQFPVRHEDENQ